MNEKIYFPYESKENSIESYRTIQKIYSHMTDDISKDMYINRLMLSFTNDIKFIKKLVLQTNTGHQFDALLNGQKNIYIYGAGIRGDRLVRMFPDKNWAAYIDQVKTGYMNGLPIIGIEKLQNNLQGMIIITNYTGYEEIKNNLLEIGIAEDKMVVLNDLEIQIQADQYFEERCTRNFSKIKGVFVDAGCFDGRDSLRYLDWIQNKDAKVYAFEPDDINWQKCRDVFVKYDNIKLYKVGLSDCECSLNFSSGDGEKARLSNDGRNVVEVNTIDAILNEQKVAFIKVDVEGNEKEVLSGARNKIMESHPNLMISIYHKREDVIEIPKLLLEINPQYHFAIGHYAVGNAAETVLYAFDM